MITVATSSIRYADKDVYVNDGALGRFIQAFSDQCAKLIHRHPDEISALLEACQQWTDDYENMPPGLKDIELDVLLDSNNVRHVFEDVLQALIDAEDDDEAQHQPPHYVAEKLLKVLR